MSKSAQSFPPNITCTKCILTPNFNPNREKTGHDRSQLTPQLLQLFWTEFYSLQCPWSWNQILCRPCKLQIRGIVCSSVFEVSRMVLGLIVPLFCSIIILELQNKLHLPFIERPCKWRLLVVQIKDHHGIKGMYKLKSVSSEKKFSVLKA